MACLKSKWFLALQNSLAFKKANEINGFVRSGMSILAISCGMAVKFILPALKAAMRAE
jgi:hypothetical protein